MPKTSSAELAHQSIDKTQFWSGHLKRFEKSSMSRRKYCSQNGLSYHAFYYWRKKLKKPSSKPIPSPCSELVEVPSHIMDLSSSQSKGFDHNFSCTMRLHYREFSLELDNHFSRSALRELIQVLNQI